MIQQEIHFSPFLKLTVLKSEGQGLCGETGTISGYTGMITCTDCRQLLDEEALTSLRSTIAARPLESRSAT